MLALDRIIPLHLADVTFPEFHPLAGQKGPVFAHLVHHEHGVLLVDTGVGWGNKVLDGYYKPQRLPLAEALEEHNVTPADIALVVNTHLHFDHCGGNSLFPEVPIYVQAAEYEAAHSQPRFTVLEWVDFPGARYVQLDGESQLLPGVDVVPTPGHTPGHQSVVIETSEGAVVLAGQAVYSRTEYDHVRATGTLPPGSYENSDQTMASALLLTGLDARRVFFSHDREAWER